MEQHSKRQRLSHKEEPLIGYSKPEHGKRPQSRHGLVEEGTQKHRGALRKGSSPFKTPTGFSVPLNKTQHSGHATRPDDSGLPKHFPRGLDHNGSPEPPLRTAVASLIQVVINEPKRPITKLLIPPSSSIVSLEGFEPLTIDTNPSPSIVPPIPTNSASSSGFTTNLDQQSTSSQAAPNSAPGFSKTLDGPAHRTTATETTLPGTTSLSINIPGYGSQIVLLSPPSTPVPSNLSGSVLSESTRSFFSTSPGISSSSRGTQSSAQPTSSTPPPKTKKGTSSAAGKNRILAPSSKTNTTSVGKSTSLPKTSRSVTKTTSSTRSSSSAKPTTLSDKSSSGRSTRSNTSLTNSRKKSTASSFITSISTQPSLTSSSLILIASTDGVILGGAGNGEPSETSNGAPPAGTPNSREVSGGSGSRVATPAVVGGVVGGLAGLTIFFLVAFVLFARRRNQKRRNAISQGEAPAVPPGSAGQGVTTTERSSTAPLAAAAFFKRLRPQSGQTTATTDTAPSERGFQNLGGRKLESVLSSRGDGYSEPGPSSGMAAPPGSAPSPGNFRQPGFGYSPGPSEPDTLSGSSFYRDSQGFHGGKDGELPSPSNLRPGSDIAPTPFYPIPPESGLPPESILSFDQADKEIAIMRPSPARTPVTSSSYAPLRHPPRPPGSMPPRSPVPMNRGQQDGLGRSHPSFDGSRGSRFTEEM